MSSRTVPTLGIALLLAVSALGFFAIGVSDESEAIHVHEFDAEYNWTEDATDCSMRVFCLHCDYVAYINDHEEIKSKVKIPPTETVMGTTEYYVSGTVEGYDYYSYRDIQDIPVTPPQPPAPAAPKDNIVLYATVGAAAAIILVGAALILLRKR